MAGVYGPSTTDVRAYAQELAQYTGGAPFDEVMQYLHACGKAGAGLTKACAQNTDVGKVFGAAVNLALADMAAVNRANCIKMASLGQDVVRILDSAGRKGAAIDDNMLCALSSCFEDVCGLVEGFCKEGWFLLVVCNERLKEEFDTLHQAIIEILKSDNLHKLPGGRDLPGADYRDITKPVRRMLRQLGSGNLTAGVASLQSDDVALGELARLLEVSGQALALELHQMPKSDMELDTLYHLYSRNSLLAAVDGFGGVSSDDVAGRAASSQVPAGLYADLFQWYDKNSNGTIEEDELQAVLADVGMLNDKGPDEARTAAANHFKVADTSNSGALSYEQFCKFYDTLVTNNAQQQLRFKMGLQVEEDLKTTFNSFASFGGREAVHEMDGARFLKLCRDCQLTDKQLSTTDVDLVFAKVKSKGQRRISFKQFLTALAMISDKKGVNLEDTVNDILAAGGPVANATRVDSVRLHDDKSTYTGVYARGGPTHTNPSFDLPAYLEKSDNTSDSKPPRKLMTQRSSGTMPSTVQPRDTGSSKQTPPSRSNSSSSPSVVDTAVGTPATAAAAGGGHTPVRSGSLSANRKTSSGDDLKDVFKSFATFGIHTTPPAKGSASRVFNTNASTPTSVGKAGSQHGGTEMDGTRFAKMCREAGLLDNRFTTTHVDIIFTMVKPKGAKKISWKEFVQALNLVAEAKGLTLAQLKAQLEECGGPAVNATTPDVVRFYDNCVASNS
eukprot:jgi/Chrzof1/9141/Cz03g37130.t1